MKVRFLLTIALLAVVAACGEAVDTVGGIKRGQAVVITVDKLDSLCVVRFTFTPSTSGATPWPIYQSTIASFTGKLLMRKCESIHAGDIIPTMSIGYQSPTIDWNRV